MTESKWLGTSFDITIGRSDSSLAKRGMPSSRRRATRARALLNHARRDEIDPKPTVWLRIAPRRRQIECSGEQNTS